MVVFIEFETHDQATQSHSNFVCKKDSKSIQKTIIGLDEFRDWASLAYIPYYLFQKLRDFNIIYDGVNVMVAKQLRDFLKVP